MATALASPGGRAATSSSQDALLAAIIVRARQQPALGDAVLGVRGAVATWPTPDPRAADSVGVPMLDLIAITSIARQRPLPADAESRAWLEELEAQGARRERAITRLRALLLRAARYEVSRRRATLDHLGASEYDDLAQQSASDALMAVLSKLDQYRGESRFSTWAYKFALLEAGVKLRRRAWHGREIPLEDTAWSMLAGAHARPEHDAETRELIAAIKVAIEQDLSARQREVLIALTLNDVPIDVLAERLGSTRGALYKTLHDARRKLRARLLSDGHILDAQQAGRP